MTPLTCVRPRLAALAVLLGWSAAIAPVHAADAPPGESGSAAEASDPGGTPRLHLSGFGSFGWAQSNRPWAVQRFIDDGGTVQADSRLGAQADLQIDHHWSAALQVKLAPSNGSDSSWRLHPSWAFVAWRPDNDWLLRAGRLRLPAYLRSEQMDVAATYAQARLPAETYGVLPPEDLDSVNLTRAWNAGGGELTLDAYSGRSKQTMRVWVRDGLGEALPSGARFIRMTTEARGLVLTWTGDESKARLGMHRVVVTPPDGLVVIARPAWVPLGPGIGYWQTQPGVPGPGVDSVPHIKNYYLAGGLEFSPAAGWTVTGEYNRVRPVGTDRSIDSRGGYLALLRHLGRWSPYLTYGRLVSSGTSLAWARTLEDTRLPAGLPFAQPVNASMRAAADTAPVFDQRSWAFGSAYALSATTKLKAEWLHTRARVSSQFDLPSGEPLFQPRSVDVLTVNVAFTF
ncbi:MAG TPA: hypothetical protein PKE61_11980 [Burkholderiaceae bacterium]|nr:hypothetical protein [Burkholderiaceae bacterium]HMZ00797.1 hypothetical protein [Burkholderiaceae bacterium]HNB45323.1 hypothetical protein [Burkholderiaceae bacterium]HNG79687.1 hypothetical protein [Burkholderiaceae bacterium]